MMSSRIAVTGVGIVSSLGRNAADTFARLVRGERGFGEIRSFPTDGQRSRLGAEVTDFGVENVVAESDAPTYSRTDALALCAARDALASAGLPPGPSRGALHIAAGVTTAGMRESEEVLAALPGVPDSVGSTKRLLTYPLSSPVTRLSEALAPIAEVATVCSACSSGANAIIQGAAWIVNGRARRVLAGGADGLCRLTLTGFNALGATDTGPCRPFDRRRAGLTLGEGAAFLVLEREDVALARGARVLAWLSGWAVAAEAFHVTHPETSGSVAAGLLESAMRRAGLAPRDVDYINAHGTGTVPNDAIETLAIRRAFGAEADRVFVSSAKGQIGHTLGAAGAIEAAITALAIDRQVIPPTGGLEEPDEACNLRHVMNEGLAAPIRAALSSSFGFGGTGVVLLFERADSNKRESGAASSRVSVPVVTGVATTGAQGLLKGVGNAEYLRAARTGPESRIPVDLAALLDPAKSRRFDAQATFVVVGTGAVLGESGLAPDGVGLASGTAFGNVDRTVAFVRTAVNKGPRRVGPAEFPHLVPSAPAGNASIYHGLSGPVLATSDLAASAESSVSLACDWIEAGVTRAFIAGGAEPFDASVAAVLGPVCEGEGALPRSEGAAWLAIESIESARERNARVCAIVRRRYQIGIGEIDRTDIDAPVNPERALVVIGQSLGRVESLVHRSGWGRVQVRSVAERTGWHEAVGGFALTAAVALIMDGGADEILVVGQTAVRAYLFHLAAPE